MISEIFKFNLMVRSDGALHFKSIYLNHLNIEEKSVYVF